MHLRIKPQAGPRMRQNVRSFVSGLTLAERLELVALLGAGERPLAKDFSEDHGYPRGVVSYLTVEDDLLAGPDCPLVE